MGRSRGNVEQEEDNWEGLENMYLLINGGDRMEEVCIRRQMTGKERKSDVTGGAGLQ